MIPEEARGKPIEVWFQDEARIGQKGTLAYVWAYRGARPRAVQDTRYVSAYLFGAVCPARGVGLPGAGRRSGLGDAARQRREPERTSGRDRLHRDACTVTPGAHAVLVLDGAGWHKSTDLVVPGKISLLKLPPYAPELDPVENIWQYLRGDKIAHPLYETYEDIVDACCDAWNWLIAAPGVITSITARTWANVSV